MRWEGTSGGHLAQAPLLKQSRLQTVAQDRSQTALEYLQGGRLHKLPGMAYLCQCSVTLTVKKGFLMFRGNLLGFGLCPMPLRTPEKSLALSSLRSLFGY